MTHSPDRMTLLPPPLFSLPLVRLFVNNIIQLLVDFREIYGIGRLWTKEECIKLCKVAVMGNPKVRVRVRLMVVTLWMRYTLHWVLSSYDCKWNKRLVWLVSWSLTSLFSTNTAISELRKWFRVTNIAFYVSNMCVCWMKMLNDFM